MALTFPNSPTSGQEVSFNGRTWIWNGTGWAMKPDSITDVSGNLNIIGKVSASNGIFSNLTDGYVPYHQNDTNGLINSPLYVSGSNIGINYTSSFNHNLVVGGSSYQSSIALYSLSGSGTADTRNWAMETNTSTYGSFSIQQSVYKDGNPSSVGIDRLFINISGSVGIGTVTPGDYKLNVNQSLAGTNGIYVTAPKYGINSSAGDIGVYSSGGTKGVYGSGGNTGVEGNGASYGIKGIGNSAGVLGQGSSAPSSIGVIASGSAYDFYASTPNGNSFFNGKILLGSTSGWALSGSNAGLYVMSGSVIMGGFTPSGFYSTGEVTAYNLGTSGQWSFAESGGDLLFKYNGVTKAKLSSNGGFYMADSIYDYRTF